MPNLSKTFIKLNSLSYLAYKQTDPKMAKTTNLAEVTTMQ